ncbi:hypothetical protein [uncultured Nostoc sp.]|uniref:hypothetical protein n=1 Tax=uncultured Nostoc sp. TaxID=340711 RepID=UPI0035C96DFA
MLKIRGINHLFNSAAATPAQLLETLHVACFHEMVRQSYFSARGCANDYGQYKSVTAAGIAAR